MREMAPAPGGFSSKNEYTHTFKSVVEQIR